jgi:hypothetical protein
MLGITAQLTLRGQGGGDKGLRNEGPLWESKWDSVR